jgi:hypothetical protein
VKTVEVQGETFERRAVMRGCRCALKTALLLAACASFGGSLDVWGQSKEEKEVTLQGEVVDLYCYLTRHQGEGKGPGHAVCTNACLRKGGSVGFVSDEGDLYVLLNPTPTPIRAKVAGRAGRKLKVTGTKIERDDVEAILVKRIERVRQGS